MKSVESMMLGASKFVSIVIVTFVMVTGGMWYAKRPPAKESHGGSSPAHWLFWLVGRDLEDELRNPQPWFDPGESVVPAWSSGQVSDFARYIEEEQEKRDRMMEEIRATWGPH